VHVLADRQRLQQVLLNLLSNAVKYNRPAGTVSVACEAVAGGGRLRITVTDTGEGIAADKLDRLFTPFDRLGAEASPIEGTGLGLALSKTLVEAMGGVIYVQSRPGLGSSFGVELSLVPAPGAVEDAVVARREPLPATGPEQPRTLLYVEDNLSNLRLVENLLSRRPGVTVLSAMQGRVGLDLAAAHRPDLILLDRHLPDMAGDEVFEQLRADPRTREIPVVILSADAIPSGMRNLLDAGVRAYLTKPLDVRALLSVIDGTFGPTAP
jgi:CheY-like chemotaxis protein